MTVHGFQGMASTILNEQGAITGTGQSASLPTEREATLGLPPSIFRSAAAWCKSGATI